MSDAGERALPDPLSGASERAGEQTEGEHVLIQQARSGDRDAFQQLVRRYVKHAYDIAYRFVGDHDNAQDVVQDAFIKAYVALPSFRGEAAFGTWLYRIVVNLAMTRKRLERPTLLRRVSMDSVVHTVGEYPGEDFIRQEQQAHVERALHELPTLQRAVIILRHLHGLSTRQVSEILQCSEGTVKTHLFRGLKNLRRKLAYLQEGRS